MNPSHLSWKIISWLSDQIFNVNHLILMGYGISTLSMGSDCHSTVILELLLNQICLFSVHFTPICLLQVIAVDSSVYAQ